MDGLLDVVHVRATLEADRVALVGEGEHELVALEGARLRRHVDDQPGGTFDVRDLVHDLGPCATHHLDGSARRRLTLRLRLTLWLRLALGLTLTLRLRSSRVPLRTGSRMRAVGGAHICTRIPTRCAWLVGALPLGRRALLIALITGALRFCTVPNIPAASALRVTAGCSG